MLRTGLDVSVLQAIPQQDQQQGALVDQLSDLKLAATKLGLYDAADYLERKIRPVLDKERAQMERAAMRGMSRVDVIEHEHCASGSVQIELRPKDGHSDCGRDSGSIG